jgi:RNA-binding protein
MPIPIAPSGCCGDVADMSLALTGTEKRALRSQGQLMTDTLRVGREGASASVVHELDRQLVARELVKVRFVDAERDRREQLLEDLATATRSACVGTVGRTSLFYRPKSPTGKVANAEG